MAERDEYLRRLREAAFFPEESDAYLEVVDSLPLGPTGKILKLELRAMDEAAREKAAAK